MSEVTNKILHCKTLSPSAKLIAIYILNNQTMTVFNNGCPRFAFVIKEKDFEKELVKIGIPKLKQPTYLATLQNSEAITIDNEISYNKEVNLIIKLHHSRFLTNQIL